METKPLKFTVEELQKIIDDYFANTPNNELTVTGLALLVGSRRLLLDYEKREGYREMIEKAKLKIENSYEQTLRTQGGAHNIFALKVMGWKDHQELDVNHNFVGKAKIEFGDNSKKTEDE